MDQLELTSHTAVRNKKIICSQKYQENKVVQTAEGVAASVPYPLAYVDGNIHYQFHIKNTGGQVAYQVIPVSDQRLESRVNVVSASSFTESQQTVLLEKIPTGMSIQTAADPTLTQTAGQFYVMMTPSDALHSASQQTLAPRTHMYTVDEHNAQQHEGFNWKMDSLRTPRDERRRAQHNEVERRRRDKINNWIVTLSKIIPGCSVDGTKTGVSKGGILSKACDYIGELKQHNQRLQESLRAVERVQMDNELLRQQLEELKSKNALLRAQLEHHHIDSIADASAQ